VAIFQLHKSKIQIVGLFFSISIFLLFKPYYVWDTPILNKILLGLVIAIAIINIRIPSKRDAIVLLFFAYYITYEMFTATISPNMLGVIYKYAPIYLLLMSIDKSEYYFKLTKNIFVISILLSLIVYFSILILGLNLPTSMISPLNPGKLSSYYQYPFLVSQYGLQTTIFGVRFYGMFDEPGALGSFVVIFLLVEKFSLRTKANKILFIVGLLTFSFYFYGCALVYLFYSQTFKRRIYLFSIIAIAFIFTQENRTASILVWERTIFVEGKVTGDNRSTERLDYYFDEFIASKDALFGIGLENTLLSYGKGTASFKSVIMGHGLIFTIVMLIAFMGYAYIHLGLNKYYYAFCFLFLGMLYNRYGFIFDPPRFFLMISAIHILKTRILEDQYTAEIENTSGIA
jgi:hypothetical protein